MASALRFAARKICSRPPQPRVWAAASAVVKEEQRTLLPRISHGGSSLRRFSSSETPNLLNNDKHLCCDAKSGLDKRIKEKKHELLELLRLREGGSSMGNEQKELVQLLRQSDKRVLETYLSDYYQLDDLLTDEEKALRNKVRAISEKEIAPIMTEYWEKAEFPFHVIPKLATLGLAGSTTKGYGCPGLSITACAISIAEVSRVDASCSAFILVHSSLAMSTIALCGSEAQKQKYLPSLAQFKTVGCWALTEPDYGSDASSLKTSATKVPGGWHLDGQKRWIGNSTFADVLIILARNADTKQLNGFIVKKGAPGLRATKIQNKIGLRMVQNGDVLLNKVFVPEEDRLTGINSFQDISKVLAMSRILVTWQPIGISMGVYDMCHRYLKERKQFGAPLAAFQLNQEKLVRMLGNIQAMVLLGWRLCKLYESGKMTPGHASLAKAWISSKSREVVSLGRELLGANGILADFLVAKAFCDLEPIFTYEGTYDINALVTGREITGIASFKPAVLANARL